MARHQRRTQLAELEELAYTLGRYADFLAEHGRSVPAWAWLNAVARGSEGLVASLALAEPAGPDTPGSLQDWYDARTVIAQEVVGTVAVHGCSLAVLQRDVLAGVELELAAMEGCAEPGPDDLVEMVLNHLFSFGHDAVA